MIKQLYQKSLELAAHKSSKIYLAIISFIESSFFPIPPDVMIVPMVIAKKNKSSSIKISKNEKQRLKFWAGRKAAFPACGDMAPDYYCMDGTIPRGKLAEVLKEIGRLSKKYNLPVANAFHAGDGNLHPLIMYDANEKNSLERTEKFGADILKYCVKVGGVLTGVILDATNSWDMVFYVVAGITFFGGIFYFLFASTEKQFD